MEMAFSVPEKHTLWAPVWSVYETIRILFLSKQREGHFSDRREVQMCTTAAIATLPAHSPVDSSVCSVEMVPLKQALSDHVN